METYKVALDNKDGTYEVVKVVNGTKEEAVVEWNKVLDKQCDEYHKKKTITTFRPVCLFDPDGVCILKES